MVSRSEDKANQARAKIAAGVTRSAKRKFPNDSDAQQDFIENALNNLQMYTDVMDANLQDADMVIEAIVENLKVKQNFFEKIEPLINE